MKGLDRSFAAFREARQSAATGQEGSRMTATTAESQDDYSTANMVRRLLIDEALTHWPLYALSFSLTAIAAAVTAFTAYLLGMVINKTYVNRDFPALAPGPFHADEFVCATGQGAKDHIPERPGRLHEGVVLLASSRRLILAAVRTPVRQSWRVYDD